MKGKGKAMSQQPNYSSICQIKQDNHHQNQGQMWWDKTSKIGMGAKICPLKSHQDCGLWGLFFMIIERT